MLSQAISCYFHIPLGLPLCSSELDILPQKNRQIMNNECIPGLGFTKVM